MTETTSAEAASTGTRSSSASKPATRRKAVKRPSRKAAKKAAKKEAPASESLFLGRDESWMLFNNRVLEEAEDASNPLLERVKYLAITASNLDEFIEIRVASLLQHIDRKSVV